MAKARKMAQKGRCSKCGSLLDFELKRRLAVGGRTVYVFDLDGTLCEGAKDMQLQVDPLAVRKTKPLDRRIGVVKKLHREGAIILIHSARATNQYIPTKSWLEAHGVPFDGLILGKPEGDVYVDDKAIRDTEFFEDAQEERKD